MNRWLAFLPEIWLWLPAASAQDLSDMDIPAVAREIVLNGHVVTPGLVDPHDNPSITFKWIPGSGELMPTAFFHSGPKYGWRVRDRRHN